MKCILEGVFGFWGLAAAAAATPCVCGWRQLPYQPPILWREVVCIGFDK
jgi:hypothetical protein